MTVFSHTVSVAFATIANDIPAHRRADVFDALAVVVEELGGDAAAFRSEFEHLKGKRPMQAVKQADRLLVTFEVGDGYIADSNYYGAQIVEVARLLGLKESSLRVMLSQGKGDIQRDRTKFGPCRIRKLNRVLTASEESMLKPLAQREAVLGRGKSPVGNRARF